MSQVSLPLGQKTRVEAVTEKAARLVFVDRLRVALVTLVVLHHVALVYGAGAPFYYVEPPIDSPLTFLVLLVFVLFNQAWFMGAFFLLAGYFTPGSFERKGPGSFLKGRLLRLGIPLILFYFVLNPLSSIGYWQMPASLTGISDPLTWQAYPYLLGMGPMWFVAMLLIFSFGYAGWRMRTGSRTSTSMRKPSLPGYLLIGVFILALALASYLLRIVIPLGRSVLDFPTLAYLPQYLTFFMVGAIASRHDWFQKVARAMGITGIVMAAVATVLLFPLALSGRMFSLELSEPAGFVGNGHWQSAIYALWDAIFAVGICLGAVTFFRRFYTSQGRFGHFLAKHSYTVYIIHIPIIVFLAVALKGIDLGNFLKFVVASIIVVPTCFAVAYFARRLPLASRIL